MRYLKLPLMAACAFLAGNAIAQDPYPSRPITIVVPYPAGGTSDIQVRKIQEPLSKLLGQPVVVDNKAGASGGIAAMAVARAKPDGYTFLYANNGLLIAPLLYRKSGYNPLKDFTPVGTVTSVPLVLVANKAVPAKNLQEFLQYARKQPNGVRYASAGTVSYGHLATVRFGQMAGIKVDHIPYKGEAGTTFAAKAGEVDMLLTTPSPTMLSQVGPGGLTMLGVGTEKPSPVVPGVPTINQAVPGFTAEAWFGLLAPAGTPDAIVQKVNSAIATVMADKGVQDWLIKTGAQAQPSSSAAFAAILKKETAQWQDIITKYNIQAE